MKTKIAKLILSFSFLLLSLGLMSQPPPPPSGGHGQTVNQVPGGGAPIGNGLFVLLALGVAYGFKKFLDIRKEQVPEPEADTND